MVDYFLGWDYKFSMIMEERFVVVGLVLEMFVFFFGKVYVFYMDMMYCFGWDY